MGLLDFFKSKSPEQKKREQFEQIRAKTIIKEQKSLMHDMIVLSPHDNSSMDVNPNGLGNFGYDKTNPIPVYGLDNVEAYMDKIRYKYTSEKSGNSTYNPVIFMRTTEDDESPKGSKKPEIEFIAGGTEAPNIQGTIDVYNLYSISNQKLTKIYINSYSLKTSNKVPEGLFHRDEVPAIQDAKVLMALVGNGK
jgi:hypothetical protein